MNITLTLLLMHVIFIFTRLDGIHWNSVTDISSYQLINNSPKVASDPDGNAVAVWETELGTGYTQIAACHYSTKKGWDASPIELSCIGPFGGNAYAPFIAMDNSGNAIAVWQKINEKNFIIQSSIYTKSTNTWSEPSNISTTDQQSITPQVGFTSAGNAIAVWRNVTTDTIQSAAYTKKTNSWSAPTSISNASDCAKPFLSVNTAGKAIVVWLAGIENTKVQANTMNTSFSWGTPKTISDTDFTAATASVVMNQAGNGIAIWRDNSNQIKATNYKGNSWSPPVAISQPSILASAPAIAMIPSTGNAIAVWTFFDGEMTLAKAATYDFSASKWNNPTIISDAQGSVTRLKISACKTGDGIAMWCLSKGSEYIIQTAFYNSKIGTWSSVDSLTPAYNFANTPQAYINPVSEKKYLFGIWNFSPDNINYVIQAITGSE